ncbi:SDR family oxidoreductase [Microscilla marina]|uniref:3-beta hydroxysteroid dehydrogenase/isomerase family n=1 Tax=Microscilla marina ATCC 23134 TaxID=313606 RepID=A1ZTM5_MICM2|nr:SDR family oxidoreductase [Microscilla marina]EAY26285.1 3-beta hydroxysteroid dehydrogenase/isomerase family [Microscilla marina ATCC 23134]
MKKVLVAGATGYLGKYVVQTLKQQGYWVRALVRNQKKLSQTGKFGEPAVAHFVDDVFVGEITRPETLKGALEGIDWVFSSVGITRQKDGLSFWEVDYQANKNLLALAQQASIEKFVFVSVFQGEALAHKLAVAQAREAFVKELKQSGIAYSIVRPSGYYSDMSEFMTMAAQGRVFMVGNGSGVINPIHGADLAEVCVRAFQEDVPEVDAGGQEMFSYQRIGEMAFDVLDSKPRFLNIPVWATKVLIALIKPFNKQQADLFRFFVTAANNTEIAPKYGKHSLRQYFLDFALQKDSQESGVGSQ